MKIKGTIFYMVDKYHPDYQYIRDPENEQTFTDTYTFDERYFPYLENCKEYMKRDLMLVAGGGYTVGNIHNIRFEFEKVG